MSYLLCLVTVHGVISGLSLLLALLALRSWKQSWWTGRRLTVVARNHPLVEGWSYARRAPTGFDALKMVIFGILPFINIVHLLPMLAANAVDFGVALFCVFKRTCLGRRLALPLS